MSQIQIGVVAPSSVVPKFDLTLGLEHLKASGFQVKVHPLSSEKHLFFSGEDFSRAQAFYEYAKSSQIDVLWAARGGYGAGRILPYLDQLTDQQGRPPVGKTLVGFSDTVALFDFVQSKWGWNVIHAPMVARPAFLEQSALEWQTLQAWVKGEPEDVSWKKEKFEFITPRPKEVLSENLWGGNLAVICSLLGTPYAPVKGRGFLFLEDISESLSRIDRMISQLEMAGYFKNLKAVILGDFTDCEDRVPESLESTESDEKKPIRASVTKDEYFVSVFKPLAKRYGFSVLKGVPVGHGPGNASLPIGGRYMITPQGEFLLEKWGGFR